MFWPFSHLYSFGPIQRLQSTVCIRKIINFWYTSGWKWWAISFRDYLGLLNVCSYDVDDVIGRADQFGFQNFCSPAWCHFKSDTYSSLPSAMLSDTSSPVRVFWMDIINSSSHTDWISWVCHCNLLRAAVCWPQACPVIPFFQAEASPTSKKSDTQVLTWSFTRVLLYIN